jgi:hypothetical protein
MGMRRFIEFPGRKCQAGANSMFYGEQLLTTGNPEMSGIVPCWTNWVCIPSRISINKIDGQKRPKPSVHVYLGFNPLLNRINLLAAK